jgi:peroxiredoxin 2/4
MAVARARGMLHQRVDTRATFVVDPEGMIRAITWYAMNVGRRVDELVRLLAALQTSNRATFSRRKEPRPWLRRGA